MTYPKKYDFKSLKNEITAGASYVDPVIEEVEIEDDDGEVEYEEEVVEDGYWYVDSDKGLGEYVIYDEDSYFNVYLDAGDGKPSKHILTFGKFSGADEFSVKDEELVQDFMQSLGA